MKEEPDGLDIGNKHWFWEHDMLPRWLERKLSWYQYQRQRYLYAQCVLWKQTS